MRRKRYGYPAPVIGTSCKDCKDRYPGCHDRCEVYQKSLAEHRKRKNSERDMRKVGNEWASYVFDNK